MNKKARIITFIIIAQFLSALWVGLCPRYIFKGESKTYRAKQVFDKSGGTKGNYSPKWTAGSTYIHIDISYLIFGLLMIYAGCTTVYLLTDKTKQNIEPAG